MSGLTFTSAALNIVGDGNSIMQGSQIGTENSPLAQMALLAPLNGAVPCMNLAGAGNNYADMRNSTQLAQVSAAYQPGKQNILFVLEAVNTLSTVANNGPALVQQCQGYLDAVKAGNPGWRIYLLTAPAYQDDVDNGYASGPTLSAGNAAIEYFNEYVRNNFEAMGCEGYVETRPVGGPLPYQPPYTYPAFDRFTNWQDGVHPSAAGSSIIAQYMASALDSMPATAPDNEPPAEPSGALPKMLAHNGKILMLGNKYMVN